MLSPKSTIEASRFQLLIDGELVNGQSNFDVINPATEDIFTQVPHASPEQCEKAIQAAKKAFPLWSKVTPDERSNMIIKLADKVNALKEILAENLVLEQGKPLAEARAEVDYTEAFLREQAKLRLAPVTLEESEERRIEQHYKALGVVAAIIPWNFPLLVIAFKLPPALMAGNTLIIKPSPTTPVTALILGEMCASIFPKGVVNIITDQNELGPMLSASPDVAKVSITGSIETGKKVMASAASTLKRLTLELGGNDPAIVLDDVNPAEIADAIIATTFMNAGQVCIAIKRLYVSEKIYDDMIDELAKRIDQLVQGDGFAPDTNIGPVQNRMQYELALSLLKDAEQNGRIVTGGKPRSGKGLFIQPTLVADIEDGTQLVDQEQFCPILPVIKYRDLDEAIAAANALAFGLGASVWSSNRERAYVIAQRINAGTVWINKHLDFGPNIPLCGAKSSGIGAELGIDSLREFTQTCVINMAK